MPSSSQYGLIILGNSGVGKSLLANILIGNDAFLHQFNATSVTHNTTSVDVTLGSHTFTIFDIPGLIEAEQERIDLNKQEIDKAFTQRPNSIVLFVFGQINGRLRGQDIVAFNAINAAYPFKQQSLLLVLNGVAKNRPSEYNQETLAELQRILKDVNVTNDNLRFTDFINVNDAIEKQALRNVLLPAVIKFVPQIHHKEDIQTFISQLKAKEEEIVREFAELEAQRKNHCRQIEEQNRIAAQQRSEQQRREAELRERLRQEEAKLIADENRRAAERAAQEVENRRYQTQLEDLRRQAEETQRNQEKIRKDREAQAKLHAMFHAKSNTQPKAEIFNGKLVDHLHDYVRETQLTTEEWTETIQFLTKCGQTCSDIRQEFILLSDILGVSVLVDAVNNPKPTICNRIHCFRPFYTDDAQDVANGDSIASPGKGEMCLVLATVKDTKGKPIEGASINVWEVDGNGLYDTQYEERDGPDMRGRLRRTRMGNGPVGKLLGNLHRHAYRPAHIHFRINAPENIYDELVTALYVRVDPYESSDAVFGVKNSLIVDVRKVEDVSIAKTYNVNEQDWLIKYDFVLTTRDETQALLSTSTHD